MHRTRFLPVAAALAAAGALLAPTAALAGGRPLSTDLIGAEEVLPADSDGMGTAHIWVNSGLGEICYQLEVANLDMVIGAHIHRAPVGVAGPIVVPLAPPTTGMSSGCAEVDPALAKEIRKSPEAFYVNVHTDVYPAGAVRGQLG